MDHRVRYRVVRSIAPIALLALLAGAGSGRAQEAPLYDFTIDLKIRVIDSCDVDPVFVEMIRAASEPTHAIVQLHRLPAAPGPDQRDEVTALAAIGITLLDYLNGVEGLGTAYLAAVDPAFDDQDPLFDELVRCLVPILPDDKLANELRGTTSTDPLPVLVLFHRDVDEQQIREAFDAAGIGAKPFGPGLWETELTAAELAALAANDLVQWIEPRSTEEMFDVDEVRDIHGVDPVQDLDVPSGVYGGLSGDGVQIAIMDSGVDDDHDDFAGRIVRFFDNGGDHGSHVAGIAAGSGAQSDQSDDAMSPNGGTRLQWRGMAPQSEIAAYSSSGASAGGNPVTMSDAVNNFGVDVSNHSYSSAPSGEYNALMAAIDSIIRGDFPGLPARPQVWSAGNGGQTAQYGSNLGYFALTKNCKNCLIVANVTDGLVHNSGSSMGPTVDGRMKPDVAAIGTSVFSVGADADRFGNPAVGNGYRTKGGTSMASPAVAGVVTLMLEQYAQTFGVNLDVSPPLPSTTRAILVQSADDLAGTDPGINPDTGAAVSYGAGPDWATGYGAINAPAAVAIVEGQGFLEDSLSLFDVTDDWAVNVQPGQTELRVTLSWDDLPGVPTTNDAAAKLVNDLDLVLIEPDGVTEHRPLVMPLLAPRDCDAGTVGIQVGTCAGLDSAAQDYFGPAAEGTDRRNNTEQVVLEDAGGLPDGIWTARVSVLNDDGLTVRLPLGGAQSYSLVLQQPNRAPVASCQPVELDADDACCVTVDVADVDGGSFDPNGDADIDTLCITAVDGMPVACQTSVEVCGEGDHDVELTITDMAGEADSCDAVVTVTDVTPPMITCPADVTLECPAATDPGSTGMASASDNCSVPVISFEDVSEPGCGGTETITRTWSATDDAMNVADCLQIVEVVDTTPPEVTCEVKHDELWPPNHKLDDIDFSFTAVDACDPDAPATAISVTSDEHPALATGAGGPLHCPDAVVNPDNSVLLRAERTGSGDGRVYAITVAATDDCGNVGTCTATVGVPHSQKPGEPIVDSGQLFDAETCDADGDLPEEVVDFRDLRDLGRSSGPASPPRRPADPPETADGETAPRDRLMEWIDSLKRRLRMR